MAKNFYIQSDVPDTDEGYDQEPVACGLEVIAFGCSLRFPEDMENLECQFEVYDALYAWGLFLLPE